MSAKPLAATLRQVTRSFDADRKWLGRGAGVLYARGRFQSDRAAGRDPRRIATLLARHLPALPQPRVLDVPCGSGRLHASLRELASVYVGADRSIEMLGGWASAGASTRIVANAAALPFAKGSFDAVICCRLLHHLHEERELPIAVSELVRVSRGVVVASFWDAASWPAWRRRRGWRHDASGRRAIDRARLAAIFSHAGADVVDWAYSFRFVSQQAFLVARKRA